MGKQNENRPNALKHGAFAQTAILPGEHAREFEELHSALIEEWAPIGPTEEDAVLSIARGVWRKRRLQRFLQAAAKDGRVDPDHPLYDEAETLRGIAFGMRTNPEFFEDLTEEDALRSFSRTADHLRQKCPRRNFESTAAWLQAVRREIFLVLLPQLESLGSNDEVSLARSFKFLTTDLFKTELAVEERIDAMIDRATKRLIQTKAMKQMLPRSSLGGDDHPPKIQNGQSNGSARAVAHKNRPGGPPAGPRSSVKRTRCVR
jgi:hypothetical protein